MNDSNKIIEQLALRIANLEIEKAQAVVAVNELKTELEELKSQTSDKK